MGGLVVCPYSSSISIDPIPSKSQLSSDSAKMASSVSVLHGFACASCTEPGNITNPAASNVAAANTAAIKIVLFFIGSKREYERIRIFELRRILLLFRSRHN